MRWFRGLVALCRVRLLELIAYGDQLPRCIILLRQPKELPLLVPVGGQTVGEDLFDGEVKRERVAHDLLNNVRREVDQAQGLVEEGAIHRFFFGNRHR